MNLSDGGYPMPEERPGPGPAFDDLTDSERAVFYDKAGELLSNLWQCTRVWEAWDVGTMTRNDFSVAAEDDEILSDTAKALFDFVQEQEAR